MTISTNGLMSSSDINAIITAINNEVTRRNTSGSLSTISSSSIEASSTMTGMISSNSTINSSHCYCQTGQGIATHNGGVGISLTASSSNFGSGIQEVSSYALAISTDITNLAAKCACNSYSCTCNTNSTYAATCNEVLSGCKSECGCNSVCTCASTNCTCDVVCTCNTVCTCEFGG